MYYCGVMYCTAKYCIALHLCVLQCIVHSPVQVLFGYTNFAFVAALRSSCLDEHSCRSGCEGCIPLHVGVPAQALHQIAFDSQWPPHLQLVLQLNPSKLRIEEAYSRMLLYRHYLIRERSRSTAKRRPRRSQVHNQTESYEFQKAPRALTHTSRAKHVSF